jgi:hypothetical protein
MKNGAVTLQKVVFGTSDAGSLLSEVLTLLDMYGEHSKNKRFSADIENVLKKAKEELPLGETRTLWYVRTKDYTISNWGWQKNAGDQHIHDSSSQLFFIPLCRLK